MKATNFPRLIKWMFFTAITFLVFMVIMRFLFYFHFAPGQYTFSNTRKAFLLGLHFDIRIVCGIVLFPFLIGNLHLTYSEKKRLTAGTILQLILTVLIMSGLLIFIKKGHASVSMMVAIAVMFALVFVWLFISKNC